MSQTVRPAGPLDRRGAALTLLALLAGVLLTPGCGVDVTSIRRSDASMLPPGAETAIATGRIRFVVDGTPMRYGLLDKPHLQISTAAAGS